jgi:hypothetical protein
MNMHISDHTDNINLNFLNSDKNFNMGNLKIFNIYSKESKVTLSSSIKFIFGYSTDADNYIPIENL